MEVEGKEVYTCYYCQMIIPYQDCISGNHFCFKGSQAVEFWDNFVRPAKALEEGVLQLKEDKGVMVTGEIKVDCAVKIDQETDLSVIDTVSSETVIQEDEQSLDPKEYDKDDPKRLWKLKLIQLVKERPGLYDKRLPASQRSFPVRARLWKEVYDGLNAQVQIETLPRKFKALRDRYVREMRKIKMGFLSKKQWFYLSHLSFLSKSRKGHSVMCHKYRRHENEQVRRKQETVEFKGKTDFTASELVENNQLLIKFVKLVGGRPPLYCRLPRHERAPATKVKLWQEVHAALKGAIPLVELPRKFRMLKERYIKERSEPLSSWPLFAHMGFLEDTLKNKKYLEKPPDAQHQQMDCAPVVEEVIADTILPDSPSLPAVSSPTLLLPPNSLSSISLSSDLKMETDCGGNGSKLDGSSPSRMLPPDSWDEDDYFGAYIARLLKKLPPEQRLRLHMEICKMLHSAISKKK